MRGPSVSLLKILRWPNFHFSGLFLQLISLSSHSLFSLPHQWDLAKSCTVLYYYIITAQSMKIFLSLLFQKYGFSEEGQKLRSEIVCPSLLRIGVCCMQATMSSGSKISTDSMVMSPRPTRFHWHHIMHMMHDA